MICRVVVLTLCVTHLERGQMDPSLSTPSPNQIFFIVVFIHIFIAFVCCLFVFSNLNEVRLLVLSTDKTVHLQ